MEFGERLSPELQVAADKLTELLLRLLRSSFFALKHIVSFKYGFADVNSWFLVASIWSLVTHLARDVFFVVLGLQRCHATLTQVLFRLSICRRGHGFSPSDLVLKRCTSFLTGSKLQRSFS